MSISEISKALELVLKAVEVKKALVKEAHDKRASFMSELDEACNKTIKDQNDTLAEAHKLRDALHAELLRALPSSGFPGVVTGISK